VTPFAVALVAVTVKVSTFGFVAVIDSTRSVETPAESNGVMVNVAVSPAAIDAVEALSENDAGYPATVQVTFLDADSAPGALVSSVAPSLSVQTEYVIVARPAVMDSPGIGTEIVADPVSGLPETNTPVVCRVVVAAAAPAIAVRAISFTLKLTDSPLVCPVSREVNKPDGVMLITAPTVERAIHVAVKDGSTTAWAVGIETSEKTPPNKAPTANCAMRFSRDVFVDIDFLSLLVKKTFSFTAGKEEFLAS
jgi:hypothetical protein